MKNLILSAAVIAAFAMSSCQEKERNCTCKTTYTYAGVSDQTTETIVYKDVTKKQMKNLCVGYTTTDDTGHTTTKDCEIQ
jgi:hypothetical protein